MPDGLDGRGVENNERWAAEQNREYSAALDEAWEAQSQQESPLYKARRRRVTSRAVMISLSVVAVCLAVGGVLAPQISYAREASRFQDIAAETNAAAHTLEELNALDSAERLLFSLRSEEVRALPAQLTRISKSTNPALSAQFKADMGDAAKDLEAALAKAPAGGKVSGTAKKAAQARTAETVDPRTWFDVEPRQLVSLADIEPEEVERVEVEGTVTLDRVQQVKRLEDEYSRQIFEAGESIDATAVKSGELSGIVASVTEGVLAESGLVLEKAQKRIAAAENTEPGSPIVDEEPWRTTVEKLESSTKSLKTALNVDFFAVNESGEIIGMSEEASLPEGAVRIPGGDIIRLKYVLPRLQAAALAVEAEQKASKEVTTAREVAAAAEAARQAAEESQTLDPAPGVDEPWTDGDQMPSIPPTADSDGSGGSGGGPGGDATGGPGGGAEGNPSGDSSGNAGSDVGGGTGGDSSAAADGL